MTEGVLTAINYLFTDGSSHIGTAFWYVLVFEVPRYLFGFIATGAGAAIAVMRPRSTYPRELALGAAERVSIVIVGHNEAGSLERCVRSLNDQSRPADEIIVVSDGSTDRMVSVALRLKSAGLIHAVLGTDVRCGKSAGFNLGLGSASGDIIIIVDCDCSFEYDAIERILQPFANPAVGAVAADIVPRNSRHNLLAAFQEVEYILSISMTKRLTSALGQVSCVSGAFGAFRRDALIGIEGYDVGGGEDLDLTLRLRRAGWLVAFAEDAICYTDVPATLPALVRQRLRWERDAVWIRLRKHARSLFGHAFSWREAVHQVDFIVFNLLGALMFPIYIAWLFATYGEFGLYILLAVQLVLFIVEVPVVAFSIAITSPQELARLAVFIPGYLLFSTWIMKPVRAVAYVAELAFSQSRNDNYVPQRVRSLRIW
ncbi:MAG: glycosyltransferase family 2 protein [Proteobacteria bacterium]|nr:glycosyltransferase family 2 protein [Pseudomonadota bacterium]